MDLQKIALGFWAACLLFVSAASASEVDFTFIADHIHNSECRIDINSFSTEFSGAIDRLNEINPKLVQYIRLNAYNRALTIKCDVSSNARGIYFSPSDQAIHLWQEMPSSWRTAASFFHEFLHFTGVKIDPEFHNNPDPKTIVEIDSVYACHISVFPQLAPLVDVDLSRLPAARNRCALASVE